MYLLALDFDGTIAKTFAPSPNKIGVREAYELAIQTLFGFDGLNYYKKSGGLQNRNPGEVVKDLQRKGYGRDVSVEGFVQKKLSYLLKEIGPEWPRPCRGFVEFFQIVQEMDSVNIAILSSGHTDFIRKTFSVWGIEPPKIMLTDDDLRGFNPPLDLEKFSKPSPLLLDLIQNDWGGQRQYMTMFGDDPEKDGKLAENAQIPFGLFSAQKRKFFAENSFQFSDWTEISEFLVKEQKLISQGLPAREIIFANT